MSIIAIRLQESRKGKGLTQKQLSELTGISEVMISQYERGIRSPKLTQLKKFADALNVTTNYLSGIDEEQIINDDGSSSTNLSFTTTVDELRNSIKEREIMRAYIEKFNELDSFGQELVKTVIDKEYERCVYAEEKDPNE